MRPFWPGASKIIERAMHRHCPFIARSFCCRIDWQMRLRAILQTLSLPKGIAAELESMGGAKGMSFAGAFYYPACGSLGILLSIGAAVAQVEGKDTSLNPDASPDPTLTTSTSTTSTGTNPVDRVDMGEIERVDECLVAQVCIDRYLWSLYERTRKVDTVRVPEQIKVAVKRKGKIRTVTKTVSKYVVEDFGWKDPKAAELAGKSPMDYVIGGMDAGFRVTLYHALRALDDAGLMPGITSAFRDDYRQIIASGQKAQSDRSFHGGSFRGGYGHGLAADIVSVKGETRAERLASSDVMWKWIDAHEQELGVGRPYRDRDAPHVGPLDGREYVSRRIEPAMRQAEHPAAPKGGKHQHVARRGDRGPLKHAEHGASKRAGTARPAKGQSKQARST
jgi:hypothetical protein